jgi:hypothetical protein
MDFVVSAVAARSAADKDTELLIVVPGSEDLNE